MEQFEPKTLRRLLESGSLPVQAVLDFGGQLADALASLHDAGRCFGGLSPAAVLISADGHARLLEPAPDEAAHYRPPDPVISASADQFAFGLILAEMLTGLRPSAGRLPSLESLRNYVPDALLQLLTRLTAESPAARFPSMHDVSGQLLQLKANWHVAKRSHALAGALIAFLVLFGGVAVLVWWTHH
jgi:serine/threonine protein kinase